MTLLQIDPARLATVLIFYPVMAIIFVIIAIRILKRNRKRLNLTFSGFYFTVALGVAFNLTYALLRNELIVLTLHYFATFFVGFSLIFLLITNRLLLQSGTVYSLRQQFNQTIIYAIFLAGLFVFLPFRGVIINSSTEWRPEWNLFFYLYVTAIQTGFTVIPIIFTSFKIFFKMEQKQIRRRWMYFILGIFGLLLSMYLTFLSNFLNNDLFRLISTLYAITIVLWAFLIYIGIGKQL